MNLLFTKIYCSPLVLLAYSGLHIKPLISIRLVISAIGTHDEDILNEITKNMGAFKIKKEDCDFEFLYGIRRDLSQKMKDEDYRVRLYVPFGTKWLPYTLRRLREYKNLMFVAKNIFKEWKGNK